MTKNKSIEQPSVRRTKCTTPDPSSSWRIVPMSRGSKRALWHWEARAASGALAARSSGFMNHTACLDDAIVHGYLSGALTMSARAGSVGS